MVLSNRYPRCRGLTLLELLVTVAIIAIALALLWPVTGAMRGATDRATCVGHLRQIGQGLLRYMQDNDLRYPPNRQASPSRWTSEALQDYVPHTGTSSDRMHTRRDAGPWFCPADRERSLGASAKSYAQARRLGAGPEQDGWEAWWARPIAHEGSYRLVYMIDHNLLRIPLSTAGHFSEKSWPLQSAATATPPAAGSGESLVDFDRHSGSANALMVDGSVQAFSFKDLHATRFKYIDPTR